MKKGAKRPAQIALLPWLLSLEFVYSDSWAHCTGVCCEVKATREMEPGSKLAD